MPDEIKIGALAPWFGSKRTLAPAILEELGEHRVYWEPFAGSMAVLLAKPKSSMETVNDLHGDLVNLARVVQDRLEGPRLYRRLRRVPASEAIFKDAVEALKVPSDGIDPDRAFAYFVASWLGRNGIAGTQVGLKNGAGHSFCVRYTANGGQTGKRWVSAVGSIPAWSRRLREVTVLRRDAFEVIARIDDTSSTAIYVDPPYLKETRSGYASAEGGNGRYLHDFDDAGQHDQLAVALARFKHARVVVSYYDHPRLADLYPGWSKRVIPTNKAIANQAKRDVKGATKVAEVLLSNRMTEAARPRAELLFA
ncbi:DNA adenine methylase [Singulisphaera sp. PoT]|uniref:DNA adenine methylase n=1 Tax=Singulisphaera sp. PoT TaxID=3411797 RepID=UPI003BF58A48